MLSKKCTLSFGLRGLLRVSEMANLPCRDVKEEDNGDFDRCRDLNGRSKMGRVVLQSYRRRRQVSKGLCAITAGRGKKRTGLQVTYED